MDANPDGPRVRIAGNLVAGSGGHGVLVFAINHVEVVDNIIHGSGRQPRHQGGEIRVRSRGATFTGNLLVPSMGRRAWVVDASSDIVRTGNRVWEGDGRPRPDVLPTERLPASPFAVAVVDEDSRTDFSLRP
jgi:hypothetical protein